MKEEYEDLVDHYKNRLIVDKATVGLFFVLLMEVVTSQFKVFPAVYWNTKWKHEMVDMIAKIRSVCDKFVELMDTNSVEHPTKSITKLLGQKGIVPGVAPADVIETTFTAVPTQKRKGQ